MSSDLKYPQKGAVAKLRDLYSEIIKKRPLTPEQRERFIEIFKKKEDAPETTEKKKIAKSHQGAEL